MFDHAFFSIGDVTKTGYYFVLCQGHTSAKGSVDISMLHDNNYNAGIKVMHKILLF